MNTIHKNKADSNFFSSFEGESSKLIEDFFVIGVSDKSIQSLKAVGD